MASRKSELPQIYDKQISAPLPAPDTTSAVNYQQLPENILWMTGDRGFSKRPGSLPFAQFSVPDNSIPSMLAALRTPAWYLSGNSTNNNADKRFPNSTTVLSYHTGLFPTVGPRPLGAGIREITKYVSLSVNDTGSIDANLARAPFNRDDTHYYLSGRNLSAVQTSFDLGNPFDPLTYVSVNSLAAQVSGGTSLGSVNQQFLPALQLGLDFPYENLLSTSRLHNSYVFRQPGGVPIGLGAQNSFTDGNLQAVGMPAGIFVAGGGGVVQHYDGYRNYLAGAVNLSSGTALAMGVTGVGVLTGTYKYFVTHKVRLPSGEIIEGQPSATVTIAPVAQQGQFTSLTVPDTAFRGTPFSTTDSGTISTINYVPVLDILTPDTVFAAPGESIYFFLSTGVVKRNVLAVLSNTSIVLDSSITLPVGTTYFSTGSGISIYRTVANGDTFFLLKEVAYANTFTIAVANDNVADSALGAQYAETETLRLAPPAGVQSIASFQGRLIVLAIGTVPYDGSVVAGSIALQQPTMWWSSALSNFYFDPENSTTFEYEQQSKPQGICALNEYLYVFFSNSIYMLTGSLDDASTFTVTRISDSIGCVSEKSICRVGNSVYFMSKRGLAVLQGTTVSFDIGQQIERILREVDPIDTRIYYWKTRQLLLVSANTQYRRLTSNSGASTSTPFYRVALDDATVAGTSATDQLETDTVVPRTLVYSFEANKWAVWNIDIFYGVTELDDDLLTMATPPRLESRTNGYTNRVLRYSSKCNWTDSGSPFTARYFSEWYDAGAPSVDKSFDRCQVFSTDTKEAGGQGFKLTVSTERDWQPGLTVDKFTDLTDFKVGYGYAEQPYASQPYGDPELAQKVLPLSNQRCKSLRLVVENSESNRNFAINGVAVEINPKFTNMKDE